MNAVEHFKVDILRQDYVHAKFLRVDAVDKSVSNEFVGDLAPFILEIKVDKR
jgi:hypothetical protein